MNRPITLFLLAVGVAWWPLLWAVGQNKRPNTLRPEVVAAWEKAGAQVGWMGTERHRCLVFRSSEDAKERDVPAFRFEKWKEGMLSTLPSPDENSAWTFTRHK
jgi:hypothetical protein